MENLQNTCSISARLAYFGIGNRLSSIMVPGKLPWRSSDKPQPMKPAPKATANTLESCHVEAFLMVSEFPDLVLSPFAFLLPEADGRTVGGAE